MAKPLPKSTPLKTQKPVAKKAHAIETPLPKAAEPVFVYSLVGAFLFIGLIGVFHHEMWRDELQVWLVGASAHNYGEFLRNMANECTPFGCYFVDFILSRFTDNPVIAQVFHLLLAAGTVYLIARYAPFTKLQKVLVSFSYFLFFEYSLIARGYALTVFFVFLFCTLYQQVKWKNRYIGLSLILFCLANTTGHAVIMALGLLGMMVADYLFAQDVTLRKKYKPMQVVVGAVITLIGIYIAMKWISPPAGNHYSGNWFFGFDQERMARSLRTFWMSLIPIPQLSTLNFWNSNFFYTSTTSSFTFTVLFLLSVGIFLFCTLYYLPKIGVTLFYLAATIGLLLFNYTNNVIFSQFAANHYGFIFVTLIASSWLAPIAKKSAFTIPPLNRLRNTLKVEKNFTYLLTGLFAVNMLAGLIAYYKDYTELFSNIERTGKYIRDSHLDKMPEAGFIDYAVSPTSAFTQQTIYYPDRDTSARYTVSTDNKYTFDMNIVLNRLLNFISRQKDSVLFISTGDYFGIGHEKVIDNIQFRVVASFYGSIVPDEYYILYIAKKFDIDKVMNDPNSFRNSATLDAMLSEAHDLYQNGKTGEAKNILLTIEEKTNGKIPHLHSYLGMIYAKDSMPADAEKEFKMEIGLSLQKEEAFFNLGLLYYNRKEFANAITSWDSTLAINPKNSDAMNNIGVCYLNFDHLQGKAAQYFEKVIQINPDFMQAYYNLLACAQSMNDETILIKYTRILLSKGVSVNDIKARGINLSDALLQKINAQQ